MKFKGNNILSVSQFDRDAIARILDVSAQMAPYAARQKRCTVLDGAILSNLFFEPSTRTRVSFGTAFNLLGGFVRETVGQENSSLSKGESLLDTAQVISGYSDVIAMRHPQMHSVEQFAQGSTVPVINGGDGANEHGVPKFLTSCVHPFLNTFSYTLSTLKNVQCSKSSSHSQKAAPF